MNRNNILLAILLVYGNGAFAQKLSPNTSIALQDWAEKRYAPSADGVVKNIDAFVKINDEAAKDKMKALGVQLRSALNSNLLTVSMPITAVQAVAELPEVDNVQAGSEVKLLMDAARENAHVNDCHAMSAESGEYMGKGVVIGIVDNGFEYAHADFMNFDQTDTRIKRVWDQASNAGNSPSGYGYGTEYKSLAELSAVRYDMTSTFHGSHVAGIASGSDFSTDYYGVAPEADLVFVSFGSTNANIIDGINYVFEYAESVGKPCVVNISLGSHLGPHDGTSTTDQAFASMVGPGRIIVGAAGNEGSQNLHASKTLSDGDTSLKAMIGFDESSTTKTAYVDVWGDKGAPLSVKAVVVDALKGKIVAESQEVSSGGETDVKYVFPDGCGAVATVQMALQKNPDNNRTEVLLMMRASSISENRKVGIVATSEAGTTVHMWNNATSGYFLSAGKRGWTEGDNNYSVGELGGESPDIISVGSYNTKVAYQTVSGDVYGINPDLVGEIGERSLFSSCGPTVDGRNKPEVVAPGCAIASATSRYYTGFSASTAAGKSGYGNYYYDVNIGTSMASPFVAGTVALWLQANPNLTPEDVRNIINASSRHDKYTGTADECDRNLWGAGKIDAYAGLLLAAAKTGIKDTKAVKGNFVVDTDRSARSARVYYAAAAGSAHLVVYNTSGQQVLTKTLSVDGEKVDLSQLPSGVYVFKLEQSVGVQKVKVAL